MLCATHLNHQTYMLKTGGHCIVNYAVEKKMEKTGCKIICGAPTTLAVKGLMMMMSQLCAQVTAF